MTAILVLWLKVVVTLSLHLLLTVPLAAVALRALRPAPGMRAAAWVVVLAGALIQAAFPGAAAVRPLEGLAGPGVLAVASGGGPPSPAGVPVLLRASLEMRQVPLTGGDVVAALLGPAWAPVTGALLLLLGWIGLARMLREHRCVAGQIASLRTMGSWEGILVRAGNVPGPFVFGVVRPCIVLPDSVYRACSPEELQAVLAHEAAHVHRGDPAWYLALALAEHLLAAVPQVRFVAREIRAAVEEAADRRALAGTPRRALGEAILKCAALPLGASATGFRTCPSAPGLGSAGRGLRRRLDALYRPVRGAMVSWAAVAATATLALGTRVF